MVALIDQGTISGKIAKTVFQEMWQSGKDPEVIIKEKGLVQITDPVAIEKMIDEVLADNAQAVDDHKSGKKKNLFGFFVGTVMKASKGQANPDLVNKILQEKLK
jgi:aspartyl-tRNA(Asn)/glutamyl-tRNA(Gln) amidotransferase subunit B